MNYRVFKYTLPFHPPFKERTGLILELQDGEKQGWGEIAPFPGRSRETLSQAQEQLLDALKNMQENRPTHPLFPSVSFGLFSALNFGAKQTTLPLCALLAGTADQILKKALSAAEEGFKCVKVKISDLTPPDALEVIRELCAHFSVRIDANRAFSFKDAMHLCECYHSPNVEYIEEPTYELDKLEEFPHPFALDESFLELSQLPKTSQFTAIIFKPSVMGGMDECLSLAKEHQKKIIFSSACETGVGILSIASLANAITNAVPFAQHALGLDTYRYLPADILLNPIEFKSGVISIPKKIEVATHLLQEIANG